MIPRMKTLRISHPAFSGIHREATIAFYRDLLGMEIVLRQDNLDFSSEEHLFFHIGDDNFIAYFVPKEGADLSIYKPAQSGSGWMDHLAIDFELEDLEAMRDRLVEAGVEVEGPIDRGYERSIYFKDPNGITIELLAWLTPVPSGLTQADVLRSAQHLREQRGAALIEDEDVRLAIRTLSAPR